MPEEKQAIQRPDGSWLIDGRALIDDLKEILEISQFSEEESGSYQTLGGFVMLQLGRVPVTGDSSNPMGIGSKSLTWTESAWIRYLSHPSRRQRNRQRNSNRYEDETTRA